jgi:hypothetical protein
MSSLKQSIVAAIIKVSIANPALDTENGPTFNEARNDFIRLLIAELFPENSAVEIPMAPKETDAGSVTSEKKKRGPMSEEAKAAMKAKREATIAAKKAGEPAPEVKEKVKKVKEVKPVDSEANLAKIDGTWRKYLKKAAGEKATKEMEGQLLTFLNAMDKDAFNGSKAEEHIKAFLEPKDDGKVETEMVIVEFKGKEYYVNPDTKRVYEGEGEYDAESEEWTNYKGVGYVGMAAFAEMEI